MKFLSFLVVFAFTCTCCKPQEKNTQQLESQAASIIPIGDYKLNPDDVILSLSFLDSEELENGWTNNVEVKKQLKAGFSYKNRLAPGSKIVLRSEKQLPEGDFYCAAEYEPSPNGGIFTLKAILKR